jgi:DNA-binding transcriptional LysR family regulator
MSHLQEAFAARYPAAQLHVEYMRPEKVYEAVRNESADLGMVSYPASSREITAIPWRNETMQLAVAPTHPFAHRDEVSPSDLNGQDYVGFDEDLTIRRELDRFLRSHGVSVNLAMHFDNIQMIKEAVALESGISILPARTMLQEIAQGRLAAVRLNAPELTRPIGILHRRRKKFNQATQCFLDLLLSRESSPGDAPVAGAPVGVH